MSQLRCKLIASFCILAVIAIGCSKDELNKLANKAKNAVSDGSANVKEAVTEQVDTAKEKLKGAQAEVQQQLKMAGKIKLNIGDDIETQACYVTLIAQGSGRPSVLQLRSYHDPKSETFPSVFLQAQVQSVSAAELVNQTLQARLFVQVKEDSDVLFSEANKPVELKIVSVEDKLVKAELGNASLLDTATGAAVTTTGQFEGVLQ